VTLLINAKKSAILMLQIHYM